MVKMFKKQNKTKKGSFIAIIIATRYFYCDNCMKTVLWLQKAKEN